MTRFFTRSGDDGYTGILGEGRVPKYHSRPEAVGVIDEATAALGLARATCQVSQTSALLLQIQRDLYNLMAEAASTLENATRFRVIDAERVAWLEAQTEALSHDIEMPKEFIIPGDTPGGAALALARTIVRRGERRIARLLHEGEIENPELLRYLNRLSSLCFVLELAEYRTAGKEHPTLARE